MAPESQIKTRILIISDTHGHVPYVRPSGSSDTEDELRVADPQRVPTGFRHPLPKADVVLHCGDLTFRSTPAEYNQTFSMLRSLNAPLKLVIAGNHDRALDPAHWSTTKLSFREDREWADEAKAIIDEARLDGVVYLEEGVHTFHLANGARLRVYASPWTPSYGSWGFQYDDRHDFDIPGDVDVAMTHGPPYKILDLAGFDKTNAGCRQLLHSISMAKPQLHCFGHIHEAWGGYLVKWKRQDDPLAMFQYTVDDEASVYVKKRKDFAPLRTPGAEDPAVCAEKQQALLEISRQRSVGVDLTQGSTQLQPGEETLFVNAAIMNIRYRPTNPPWLVDLNLPASPVSVTSAEHED